MSPLCIITNVDWHNTNTNNGSIAQLVRAHALQAWGHRFESCCSHHWFLFGPVVQLVRTPACHAGGRRFEPVPGRHLRSSHFRVFDIGSIRSQPFASVAQLVEQGTENPRVIGSIPIGGTISQKFLREFCGSSSSGRAPPCQGGGSEFEPRLPLQTKLEQHFLLQFSIWHHSQAVRHGSAKP